MFAVVVREPFYPPHLFHLLHWKQRGVENIYLFPPCTPRVMLLRRRLANKSTAFLIRRAERLIAQLPNQDRRKKLRLWLEQLREVSPEERLRKVLIFLLVIFALGGVAMAIGYAVTGK